MLRGVLLRVAVFLTFVGAVFAGAGGASAVTQETISGTTDDYCSPYVNPSQFCPRGNKPPIVFGSVPADVKTVTVTWNGPGFCSQGTLIIYIDGSRAGNTTPNDGPGGKGEPYMNNGSVKIALPLDGQTHTLAWRVEGYEIPPPADGGCDSGVEVQFAGTVTAQFAVPPPVTSSISGVVTQETCSDTACSPVPVGEVTVVATSDKGSGKATTDENGAYTIRDLEGAVWTVKPLLNVSLVSDPTRRIVPLSVRDAQGADFDLCLEQPPRGSPIGACVPQFDYEMPPRWSLTGDVDMHGGAINRDGVDRGVYDPQKWPVLFTIRKGACDLGAEYTWFVDGDPVAPVKGHNDCSYWLDFKKLGSYTVKVVQKLRSDGPTSMYEKRVIVQDFLIASIGDSMASGEGNPPYTSQLPSTDAYCHRSDQAYGAVASKQIENLDTHSSVTFIPLACSGATLQGLGTPRTIVYQLHELKDIVGDRTVDALTISIGVNDVDFGFVLWKCWLEPSCQDRVVGSDAPHFSASKLLGGRLETLGEYETRLVNDLNYDQLEDAIREYFPTSQLRASDIYLVDYINPLYASPGVHSSGVLCSVLIPGSRRIGTNGFTNKDGEYEVTWAEGAIENPLQAKEASAAHRNGWTFVQIPPSVSAMHGYCNPTSSWFYNIQETAQEAPSAWSAAGFFHPKPEGQDAVAQELLAPLNQALFPDGTPRPPRQTTP